MMASKLMTCKLKISDKYRVFVSERVILLRSTKLQASSGDQSRDFTPPSTDGLELLHKCF